MKLTSDEYRHGLILTNRFVREARKLDKKYREILEKRLKDIANNPLAVGKRLRGPYRDKLSERLNRRFRIIFSIPRECEVLIEDLYHRDIAYR